MALSEFIFGTVLEELFVLLLQIDLASSSDLGF